MLNKIDEFFSSEKGKKIYGSACEFLDSLSDKLKNGVIVGFSGGADSVMLLIILRRFCQINSFGMPVAVHINHMIRGEEALRDREFSRDFAKAVGVEFVTESADIPLLAKSLSRGLEEVARDVRYSIFRKIKEGRNISSIAVAHNATDNTETVIINMMRGSGLRGLLGIPPERDDIIRPLLKISKCDIIDALESYGIPYVTDSTNFSVDYTRNYVRHEILPKLKRLSQNPDEKISRLTATLRDDEDFLLTTAEKFYSENSVSDMLALDAFLPLHNAIKSRVICLMAKNKGSSIEKTHISKILSLAGTKSFSVSIPSSLKFISDGKYLYVRGENENNDNEDFFSRISLGVNDISGFSGIIVASNEKFTENIIETSSNVYKISIQQRIKFDIINEVLYVRGKKDGDAYRYGGMTHKLKKLYNDRSIPPKMRNNVPIFCDDEGIFWVPGFSVRSDRAPKNTEKTLYIAIANKLDIDQTDRTFFIPK